MSKTNYRNKTKKLVEFHNKSIAIHNDVFSQIVGLYQSLIVNVVEDDTPEEKPLREFIFNKCNQKWIEYCEAKFTREPRPDSFYFFNHIKDLV